MDQAALNTLLKSQPALWRGRDRYTTPASIPTGFTALDAALPGAGWSIGGVTELLVEQQGIGELSLLLPALSRVAQCAGNSAGKCADKDKSKTQSLTDNQQWAAMINPPHIPYAPAFSNAGIALDRLLIIDSGDDMNTLWATEQVLRSGLFGAVIAWVTKSSAQRQRRLQLAAEAGGSWAAVYRPLQARNEHSPVSTRICITRQTSQTRPAIQSKLTLDIIKVRAGNPQQLTIEPEEFDASQGAEWPVPKSMPDLRGISQIRG